MCQRKFQVWNTGGHAPLVGNPRLFRHRRTERDWAARVPDGEQRLQVVDSGQLRVSGKLQLLAREVSAGHAIQQLPRGLRQKCLDASHHQTGQIFLLAFL